MTENNTTPKISRIEFYMELKKDLTKDENVIMVEMVASGDSLPPMSWREKIPVAQNYGTPDLSYATIMAQSALKLCTHIVKAS